MLFRSVSASGYFDWRDREPSARAVDNELLGDRIEQIHGDSKAIYGEPKIRAALRDESVPEHDVKVAGVGKHRVARLILNSSVALSRSLANPRQTSRLPSPPGRGSFLPSPWGRSAGDEGGGVTLPSATEESRLMRARHLRGVCKRRSYTVTTKRNKKARPAPDLVERAFVADAPNPLWVADMK